MSEIGPNDVVMFKASIPPSAGAIKFDGRKGEGGSITFLVPGSDEDGLHRMLLLRGCAFVVTAAAVQTELPLTPVMPEEQERLFPTDPAFQRPLDEQAAAIPGSATGANVVDGEMIVPLPDHVHTFGLDGRCMAAGCTYRREPVFGNEPRAPVEGMKKTLTEAAGAQAVYAQGPRGPQFPSSSAPQAKPRRVRRGALAGRKKAKA